MAVKDILIKYAPIGLRVLKDAVKKVSVTGKTADSIYFVVDTVNMKLQYIGRGHFETLETYRGPRKSSTYGHFDDSLEDWLKAKGFTSKTSKSGVKYYQIGNQWFTAKSLAWKINKDGNKKFSNGEKVRNVYSNELEKFADELKEAVKEDQKKEFKKNVMDSLK